MTKSRRRRRNRVIDILGKKNTHTESNRVAQFPIQFMFPLKVKQFD